MRRGSQVMTLVELMVSLALVSVILGLVLSITDASRGAWTSTVSRIEQFRAARLGFDVLTRRLSEATLNPYWDYERDSQGNPIRYTRHSELRFLSGTGLLPGEVDIEYPSSGGHAVFFQAPLGFSADTQNASLKHLLNTWGYYLEFGDDSRQRPPFITADVAPLRHRFRLMELCEPSERLSIYRYTSGKDSAGVPRSLGYTGREWMRLPLADSGVSKRVVAENVVALVLLPRFASGDKRVNGKLISADELAPRYDYDSSQASSDPELNTKHQLPPVVQVTLVAVDEPSYSRFQQGSAMPDLAAGARGGADLFTDARLMGSDLALLEDGLASQKLNFRVFTASVSLKAAKWSREQP
jgi:uncharacterized protein (TIGR02599 family)